MQKKMAFANLLNDYLLRRERTAAWLAAKLGISASTVNRWTNGETKPGSMAAITQVIELLAIDNDQERAKLYQAAGFPVPTMSAPAVQKAGAPPPVAQSQPPLPAVNGQIHTEAPVILATAASDSSPVGPDGGRQRRPWLAVLVALAAFAVGPAACDTAQRLWLSPPVATALPTLNTPAATPAPQTVNIFNAPVETFINQVENLTIVAGDSPEEKQRKAMQRAALIAGEVRYYLAQVDNRLGLIKTALAEDAFGQQLAQTRATVAPAIQEVAAAGYQTLIVAEQVNGLRQQLNSYPLPTQPGPFLLQLAGEGVIDPAPLRFFYDQLHEVTWATESLVGVLGEQAEETDERWQRYYDQSTQVAVALVANRSAMAQVAGLQLLSALATTEPAITDAPMNFTHLTAYPLLTTATANPHLSKLADDAAQLQRERQSLLAEGERLLAEDLKTYEAINQELVIQPDDSWEEVVAKAISLRQLGRTAEAVAAFAQYGELFAATDPTAEQYATVARHFTVQMATLGVIDGAVYLFAVEEKSRAAQADLQVGDIVIAVNEQPVSTVPDLQKLLETMPVGEPLTLTLLRLNDRAFFIRETITIIYEKPLEIGYMPI